MDKTIESFILKHKKACGELEQVTPEERAKFEIVNSDYIRQQIINLFPGDSPFIESIDPTKGKVIFQDRFKRNTVSLGIFGYRLQHLDGKEIYTRSKKKSTQKNY